MRGHQAYRGTPVIVLTTRSDAVSREAAMSAGATDYWLKGAIQPADLKTRIAAFLPNSADWVAPVRQDPIHAF